MEEVVFEITVIERSELSADRQQALEWMETLLTEGSEDG